MPPTGCGALASTPAAVARPLAAGNRTCAGASTSYAQTPPPTAQRGAQQQRQSGLPAAAARAASFSPLPGGRAVPSRRASSAVAAFPSFGKGETSFGQGEIVEVKDLKGIRVLKNEDETPRVEYLVEWKDGSPDTWEPATNLADNLLRDYQQRWWNAVKKADEEQIDKMMEAGGDVLAVTVDENRRSALHFAAALGKPQLVEKLLKAGGEVDLADKEGYTPLHMAAGYMHTTTIGALLAGGADPEQEDRQGRSPLELVEGLRAGLPPGNPNLVQRRMALENVVAMLTANMFEDVEPTAVLAKREVRPGQEKEEEEAAAKKAAAEAEAKDAKEGEAAEAAKAADAAKAVADDAAAAAKAKEGEEKKEGEEEEAAKKEAEEAAKKKEEEEAAGPVRTEWLVKFGDEEEPIWVDAKYVSQEVVDDFESGLEYAQAAEVVDCRQRGTMRKYLVRWQDDYPDTWEPEEHVSPDLVAQWEQKQREGKQDGGNGSSSSGPSSPPGERQAAGSSSEHAVGGAAAAPAPAEQLQGTAV